MGWHTKLALFFILFVSTPAVKKGCCDDGPRETLALSSRRDDDKQQARMHHSHLLVYTLKGRVSSAPCFALSRLAHTWFSGCSVSSACVSLQPTMLLPRWRGQQAGGGSLKATGRCIMRMGVTTECRVVPNDNQKYVKMGVKGGERCGDAAQCRAIKNGRGWDL